jgi:hypothetical protein
MKEFQRVLELAPAESILRTTYGRWLAGIGYLDRALGQIEIGAAIGSAELRGEPVSRARARYDGQA